MLVFSDGGTSNQPDHERSRERNIGTIDGDHEAISLRAERYHGWSCDTLNSLPGTAVLTECIAARHGFAASGGRAGLARVKR